MQIVLRKRVYAKVRLSWELLYLGFFWAGTSQEDKVALEVDKVLAQFSDAVASVSDECFGAMASFPVIGTFSAFDAPTVREQNRQLTASQRGVLLACCVPGGVAIQGGAVGRTAKILLAREWVEMVDGRWLATAEGRERIGYATEAEAAE